jgi:hypothetical protein
VIAKVEHHLGELFPRVGFIVTTLTGTNRAVVHFYNQRGTAEQWIKEGKEATHWTRLSCHRFRANEVRLLLGVIAYNLGNLLRRLALPLAIQSWSLTSLQQRLFKTGGRLIRHARYFVLQLAESRCRWSTRMSSPLLSRNVLLGGVCGGQSALATGEGHVPGMRGRIATAGRGRRGARL